jgi:uncharacterized membrane protein
MTGFETKFFCNSIAHFRFNFDCKFSEKLTVCVSFSRKHRSNNPTYQTTDEIKGSIIAPSLVTAVAVLSFSALFILVLELQYTSIFLN